MKNSFIIIYALLSLSASAQSHSFALADSCFLLDGKPFQMISGEMHCARIPKEYWQDRMKMAKAMGLNTIGTYVFWNAHEPSPGKYDFSGNNNIAEFIKAAQEEGLWVVLRPSPYVCAEWEFGGYPWWLLKDSTVKVRSRDVKFVAAYRKYIHELAKQLVPLLVTHGGNIIMVQLENEYGSYDNDKEYLALNRDLFREAGFDGILFTCDGADKMVNGYLPGYLPAVNGLEDPPEVKKLINKYHEGKGPYYIAEWYPGWFDDWGRAHSKGNADKEAEKLDKILEAGISVNMYMFHGGTTRDFMNGANMNNHQPYAPQTSSYDYDAPLDEAGNPTEKYFKFREIIAKHLGSGVVLPSLPEHKNAVAIDTIRFTEYAEAFDNLPEPVVSKTPLCFEDLNQAYGFVLYRSVIKAGKPGYLKSDGLRDYAIIYTNGKQVATLDRRLRQDSVWLADIPPNATLDIWVENNGRINYGPYLIDNRKGIVKPVTLNGTILEDWKMYGFPFENTNTITFKKPAGNNAGVQPAFYKGYFTLSETSDTYLDMRSFGKGFVFLNEYNLGKYWQIGPQQTIYIPSGWLKKGKNEIVVFDELKQGHHSISSLENPILNQLATGHRK